MTPTTTRAEPSRALGDGCAAYHERTGQTCAEPAVLRRMRSAFGGRHAVARTVDRRCGQAVSAGVMPPAFRRFKLPDWQAQEPRHFPYLSAPICARVPRSARVTRG